MGVLFAFLALLSWGFGDFLIEKNTRKFGDWVPLFYITAIGAILLLPFVYRELPYVSSQDFLLLLATSLILFLAALIEFEALRIGKISVIEPIYALEVVVTAVLASLVIGERLGSLEYMLISLLVGGIALVSLRSFSHFRNLHLEAGVGYALGATLLMGGVNFLFGLSARVTSPLVVNWFVNVVIVLGALLYLALHRRLGEIVGDWRKGRVLIIGMSLIDNLAWIFFSYSVVFIPIAITTSISESYIAIAALLGIFFNREKLKVHQIVGMVVVLLAVVILAWITGV